MQIVISLVVILATVLPLPALSQGVPKVEGLPIGFGASLQEIHDAYKTDLQPEPYKPMRLSFGKSNLKVDLESDSKDTHLRLKTRGVWFFLDAEGKVRTIRLDAPFKGAAGGIKLGATRAEVLQAIGEPPKKMKQGAGESFTYYFDDVTTAQFSFDHEGRLETIFLFK